MVTYKDNIMFEAAAASGALLVKLAECLLRSTSPISYYWKSEIFLGRRQGPRPRKIQAKLTSFCFARETHVRVNAFGFTKRNQVMGGRRRAVFWCVVPGRCARLLLACKRAVLS
jgi:hypothetical protein